MQERRGTNLKSMKYAILIAFFFILFSSACFDPKEGCLELSATNFDASADENCCCIYPQLRLNLTQQYDGGAFKESGLYSDANGKPFYLRSVSYYLSDFTVFQQNTSFVTNDTVTLRIQPPGTATSVRQRLRDDVVLVRRTAVNNDVGVFRGEGTFNGLRLRLGLRDSLRHVLPQSAASTHPLAAQPDSMWRRPNGYVYLQVVVARDTTKGSANDTISFYERDLPNFFIEQRGLNNVKKLGTALEFSMIADYKKMLEGIIWLNGDISVWKNAIKANLQRTFSVQ
jgi:hypothetical protein